MINANSCHKAYQQINKVLKPTPLILSDRLSESAGHEVYLKLENKFYTGSFKERGSLNFILSLTEKEKSKGICAASAGNHALALSYHAKQLGICCHIVMPKTAPLIKFRACQKNSALIYSQGETFDDAQTFAKELCRKEKLTFVPAFDHKWVIEGQASCAWELLEQLADFDSVVVPIGGGGLISGIASVLKEKTPEVYILGVQSEWAVRAQQNRVGGIPGLIPISIADGIAVKKIGKITSSIIKRKVDKTITVSESQIAKNMVEFLEQEKSLIEGAAACVLSGLKSSILPKKCKKTVLVISGSNIDMNLVVRLIERDMAENQKVVRMLFSLPDRPGALNAVTSILASSGVNILQVHHNRAFSSTPGNVEVTFLLEVRDSQHKNKVISVVKAAGIDVKQI